LSCDGGGGGGHRRRSSQGGASSAAGCGASGRRGSVDEVEVVKIEIELLEFLLLLSAPSKTLTPSLVAPSTAKSGLREGSRGALACASSSSRAAGSARTLGEMLRRELDDPRCCCDNFGAKDDDDDKRRAPSSPPAEPPNVRAAPLGGVGT
jgi:hypothetical protein